jgi:hypothetical protein
VVIVTGQIFLVDKEIVIFIQLPELAVDDVKVLVAEIVGDLVNVLLVLQQANRGQQIRMTQFGESDLP